MTRLTLVCRSTCSAERKSTESRMSMSRSELPSVSPDCDSSLLRGRLEEQDRSFAMRSIFHFVPKSVPRTALYGLETLMIASVRTHQGEKALQFNAIGAMPVPGIPIKYIRPAWLRYVRNARKAVKSDQKMPNIALMSQRQVQKRGRDDPEISERRGEAWLTASCRVPVLQGAVL